MAIGTWQMGEEAFKAMRKERRLTPLPKPHKTGKVVKTRAQKTVMVEVTRTVKVPKYGKIVKKRRKLPVHDEVGTHFLFLVVFVFVDLT